MSNISRTSSGLTLFAVILAFVVVTLGAYTRLTDAGLGCPDWPGCYNHLTVPGTPQAKQQALKAYPNAPVEVTKAWTEMVHRYAAGTLGITVLALAIMGWRKRNQPEQSWALPLVLMGLVIFQAMLGMWTVTMKLAPIVVMGHLLGGMTILAILWWLYLKLNYSGKRISLEATTFKPWAVVGLIILSAQIALGGWTSANYAALVCPNFPYCAPHAFFPQIDFREAFNLFNAFSGYSVVGNLSHAALITIQMTHRIGALITGLYLGLLSIYLLTLAKSQALRISGFILLLLLLAQITLGVLNIALRLPLPLAVAHNGVAALLLLSMVTITFMAFRRTNYFS